MWHAQITELRLRELPSADAYTARERYTAILTARFLGDRTVFVEGMLKITGRPFGRDDFYAILKLLREQYGVVTVEADRHGRRKVWSTDEDLLTEPMPL